MKKFTSISDLQILRYAYSNLLEMYLKEKERSEKGSTIATVRAKQYKAQLEEMHGEIRRLEKQQ